MSTPEIIEDATDRFWCKAVPVICCLVAFSVGALAGFMLAIALMK